MGLVVFAAKIVLTILNTVFAMMAVLMVLVGVLVYYVADILIVVINPVLEQLRSHGYPDASLTYEGFDLYALSQQIAWPLIICGTILFIISFLGCCGANGENRIFLIVYAVIVGAVLLAEILAVIVLASGQETFKQQWIDEGTTLMKSQYKGDNGSDVFSVAFNAMQMGLNCCGIANYTELQSAVNWARNNSRYYLSDVDDWAPGPLKIPFACCVMRYPMPSVSPVDLNCGKTPTATNSYMDMPCRTRIEELIWQYDDFAILACVCVLGVQAAIFALTILIIVRIGGSVNPII